jgi:hypothetical protein
LVKPHMSFISSIMKTPSSNARIHPGLPLPVFGRNLKT